MPRSAHDRKFVVEEVNVETGQVVNTWELIAHSRFEAEAFAAELYGPPFKDGRGSYNCRDVEFEQRQWQNELNARKKDPNRVPNGDRMKPPPMSVRNRTVSQ